MSSARNCPPITVTRSLETEGDQWVLGKWMKRNGDLLIYREISRRTREERFFLQDRYGTEELELWPFPFSEKVNPEDVWTFAIIDRYGPPENLYVFARENNKKLYHLRGCEKWPCDNVRTYSYFWEPWPDTWLIKDREKI